MDSRLDKQQASDMKTDMKLLLECMDYQKDNPSALKQALVTLSSMLQGSDEGKDIFRDTGSLQSVLEIVTTTKYEEVTQAGLYCLANAVERNVFSQKLLSSASVFTYLHSILSTGQSGGSIKKKQTATYLILCLVSNNGFGQNLMRQSSCLHDIVTLIRTVLPKNLKDVQCDGEKEAATPCIHLWSALVSTACVSVNNPLNEENQRICASLLPYIFSLLQRLKHDRIVRPIMSLVGLTAANNGQNQDRVRKCGGLEIFIKKLESYWRDDFDDSSDHITTAVQILNTLDSCITDNDLSCKRFGDLGGIGLVMEMLRRPVSQLDDHHKMQAVLTLAHAVDVHSENQKYITKGDGMTILIQQLTQTEDDELSKTIKYLLHLCVDTGRSADLAETTDKGEMNHLMGEMEKMKRHSDLAMLKKIQELDDKLLVMSTSRSTEHKQPNEDVTSVQDSYTPSHTISAVPPRDNQSICSHPSYIDNHTTRDCPTPREKSLMDLLVKEKVERERLEKFNQVLQDNVYLSHTALSATADIQDMLRQNLSLQGTQDGQNTSNNRLGQTSGTRSGLNYQNMSFYKSGIVSENAQNSLPQNVCHSKQESRQVENVQNKSLQTVTNIETRQNANRHSVEMNKHTPAYASTASHVQNTTTDGQLQDRPFVAIPLDLSTTNNSTEHTSHFGGNIENSLERHVGVKSHSNYLNLGSEQPFYNNFKSATNSKHTNNPMKHNAEIQCGTPYVYNVEKQKRDRLKDMETNHENDENNNNVKSLCTMDEGCQTNIFNTPALGSTNKQTGESVKSNRKRTLIEDQEILRTSKGNESETVKKQSNQSDTKSFKYPVVVLPNILNQKSEHFSKPLKVISPSPNTNSNYETIVTSNEKSTVKQKSESHKQTEAVSTKSSDKFIKPTALPPRSKVRITPLLGSNKLPKSFTVDSKSSTQDLSYDSDMQSEFDLKLLKKGQQNQITFSNMPAKKTPWVTDVVKSQNNVRQLDKHVQSRSATVTENWCMMPHPGTPRQQSIVPLRPAFSDCGMRRPYPDSPYSAKSVGRRKKSTLNDSGIHSPTGLLNMSSDSSTIDSNIDGCRSSSDISDDEDKPPNITAAVLRSTKMNYYKPDKCYGCQSIHRLGGPLLNSRTYNIALETDPNTCGYHRKLRQLERIYLHKLRKDGVTGHKMSMLDRMRKQKNNNKTVHQKDNVYDYASETEIQEVSLSDDEASDQDHAGPMVPYKKAKLRRKRVPYTAEEEDNLREGVQTMGKCWNQILVTYKFHSSRTNVDLKDKYKRLRAAENDGRSSMLSVSQATRTFKPLSMCEERRLRRGIKLYGYSWKSILQAFTFAKGRTTEDLRNKWRSLHRNK